MPAMLRIAISVLVLGAVVTACGDDSPGDQPQTPTATETTAVENPRAPGPYLIGATERSFTRPDADGNPRTLSTVIIYPATAAANDAPVAPEGPFLSWSIRTGTPPTRSRRITCSNTSSPTASSSPRPGTPARPA
jgi:hypothetical protein